MAADAAIAKGELGTSVALNKSVSEPKFLTADIRLSYSACERSAKRYGTPKESGASSSGTVMSANFAFITPVSVSVPSAMEPRDC